MCSKLHARSNSLHRVRTLSRLAAAFAVAGATSQTLHAQGSAWTLGANGHWYAQTPGPIDWNRAEAAAQLSGGHLVTVRSQIENNWLDTNFFTRLSSGFHWLGFFQDTNDPNYAEPAGGWKWTSGDPVTFANWTANAPDDAGGGQNVARSNGALAGVHSGEWQDERSTGVFPGTGGPGANFDWRIAAGTAFVFNTSNTTIVGGPNYQPTTQQAVLGGVIDVRNLLIEDGAILKIEGPNPLVVLASGTVQINGVIIASGNSNSGVNTLNTTNIPEPGATGQAGGGRGGTGSPLTTMSSPKGGDGYGAFNTPGLGGGGGETGWSNSGAADTRRGAGGGGGRFGHDVVNPTTGLGAFDQRMIGLDAERGFDNLAGANGAIHGPGGPHGGDIGHSPFLDGNANNDFYGEMFDALAGTLVTGELMTPWAGAGGGAGGDASYIPSGSFPGPWNPTGDEKGAGGAGGGGEIHVLALGNINFGVHGQIRCRGGLGGGGENTLFLDRVGGGSGGGSGGHVILQSAAKIDMHLSSLSTRAVVATGGQGGAGASDVGGAILSVNGQIETAPSADACPPGYATSGVNPCRGQVQGAGGDGGPGIIQLHSPTGTVGTLSNASADILVPSGLGLRDVCAPPPLVPGGSAVDGNMILAIEGGFGLVEVDGIDCNANSIPDSYEISLDPGLDLDGNGVIDACQTVPCYVDADGDGFGVGSPVSYGWPCGSFHASNNQDCDDTNAAVFPGAQEICNGVDDNCNGAVDEGSSSISNYCTAGTSVNGCVATMAGEGIPSASLANGFDLVAHSVEGRRMGLFVYGFTQAYFPWGPGSSSIRCVAHPLQRTRPHNSGGTLGACDGELRLDFNDWLRNHPTALGAPFVVGQQFYVQGWYRDPGAPKGSTLTDGLQFALCN